MIVTLRYFVAGFFSLFLLFSRVLVVSWVYIDDLTDYAYEIIMKTCPYIKRLCRFLTSRMTKIVARIFTVVTFCDLLWRCKRRWCFFSTNKLSVLCRWFYRTGKWSLQNVNQCWENVFVKSAMFVRSFPRNQTGWSFKKIKFRKSLFGMTSSHVKSRNKLKLNRFQPPVFFYAKTMWRISSQNLSWLIITFLIS